MMQNSHALDSILKVVTLTWLNLRLEPGLRLDSSGLRLGLEVDSQGLGT